MDNVELVVNFEVPREPESYIHRIGRTGRAGATGKAVMLVSPDEKHLIYEIEKTQKIALKKSDTHTGVADTEGKFSRVHLDNPLPPSEKKRRMMERRERGAVSGGKRGSRFDGGSRGGSRGSFSRGSRSEGRSEGRSSYGERSSSRSYGERDSAPRSFTPREGAPARAPRSDSRSSSSERPTYGERSSAPRTFSDRPRSDERTPRSSAPRRDEARSPRPFAKSVGGYDMDFVHEQRYVQEGKFLGRKAADRSGKEFDPRKGRPARTPRPGSNIIGEERPRSYGSRGGRPEGRSSYGERSSAPRSSAPRSSAPSRPRAPRREA